MLPLYFSDHNIYVVGGEVCDMLCPGVTKVVHIFFSIKNDVS